MRLEALTLNKLEEKINEFRGDPDKKEKFEAYCNAQAGRSEWLSFLQKTATRWTVIASYQAVKYRVGLDDSGFLAALPEPLLLWSRSLCRARLRP